MTIVTPSEWLKNIVERSFLSEYPIRIINNGVNLDVFRPAERSVRDGKTILGVANVWSNSKGLRDFVELRRVLPSNYRITLVGVTNAQRRALPRGIDSISRTENIAELVALYQKAAVFANPTYSDNFPTTNVEALACGTPIVAYDTGGSPEAVDHLTGRIVSKGDVQGLADAIIGLVEKDQTTIRQDCRSRAERLFNQADRFAEYIDLFESAHERRVEHG
jgi:glycosyltransferase involved in cell wall biosynthesis